MVKQFSLFGLLTFLGLMSVGCCANKPMNVAVSLDDDMRKSLVDHKIEVDITVLNEEQAKRWSIYSMTDYWRPGDTLRDSVPTAHLIFDPTKTETQKLWTDDPKWKQWLANVNNDADIKIYVLALLPGMTADATGSADRRRKMVPLDSCHWHNVKDIQVQITKDGVNVLTPYKSDN